MADPERASPVPAALIGFLLVVATAVTLLWLWPHAAPAPAPAPKAAQPEPPAPATKPLQAPVEAQKTGPQPAPASKMMRYPDGTEYPPLNGVKDPPVISWPAQVPYSPVVGKFTDPDGLEWYKHADGTRSTVQMMWRTDLKRMDPISRVENPTTAVKVDDGKD